MDENNTNSSSAVSVNEAADALGVSARTVWRMISGGQLQVVRIRRCTRIPRKLIEELLNGETNEGRS